jgi:hypothetical protein
MRARAWYLFAVALIVVILAGVFNQGTSLFAAQHDARQTEILVSYTQHEWWLMRWSDNAIMCQIYTDHADLPTPNEIETYCGTAIYNQWLTTRACSEIDAQNPELTECAGFYLHFIASEPRERTLLINLPRPKVWITLADCDPIPLGNRCQSMPVLLLTAEEPLPNEYILTINGSYNNEPFTCLGEICEIPLRSTGPKGVTVEFWADSSFNDSSELYQAQVRVVETGVTADPAEAGWYVDVLSSQWLGGDPVASCAQSWQAFPPIGGLPPWLANPEDPIELLSTEPYVYLAGQLIANSIVDASDCPNGGLLENGWADACGLEIARTAVDIWQNRFDEDIIAAAEEARVPSQLLKNIFAQETQFWPGAVTDLKIQEFGFGRLTELGTDTVLLWNPTFFNQFCPLILDSSVCALGYAQLEPEYQAMMRGALAVTANVDCPDCEAGIDLTYTGFNIQLFAQLLQANCEQTGQLIKNTTQLMPGDVSIYEDLWRFTLVNYHAGPGCLGNAIQSVWRTNVKLTWDNVSASLEPVCQSAVNFVDNVAKGDFEAVRPPVIGTLSAPPTQVFTPGAPTPTSPPPTPTGGPYPPPGSTAPPPTPYP